MKMFLVEVIGERGRPIGAGEFSDRGEAIRAGAATWKAGKGVEVRVLDADGDTIAGWRASAKFK